jgi:prepilin-type N-terminal cleavage/methylation domain-containing protein
MKFKRTKSGLSLVELIVVISIFAGISLLVLVKFSVFNNTILTNNLAYDIALSIRQAQTFGINVRGVGIGGSAVFDTGFGVRFSSSSPGSYIFFGDTNKDKQYQGSELIEVFSLLGGNVISEICGVLSSGLENCTSLGDISAIDIVFTRPDPDAVIRSHSPEVSYQSAKIYLTSPKGIERLITTELTGQISVQASDR